MIDLMKEIREYLYLEKNQLSMKAGFCSVSQIWKMENGMVREPKFVSVLKIAQAFVKEAKEQGLELDDFLNDINPFVTTEQEIAFMILIKTNWTGQWEGDY